MEYCCEDYKKACETEGLNEFIDNGHLEYGYEWGLKIKLNYCPACGKKL